MQIKVNGNFDGAMETKHLSLCKSTGSASIVMTRRHEDFVAELTRSYAGTWNFKVSHEANVEGR